MSAESKSASSPDPTTRPSSDPAAPDRASQPTKEEPQPSGLVIFFRLVALWIVLPLAIILLIKVLVE